MSSTAVLTDAVQLAAEQRSDNNTTGRLKQPAAGRIAPETPAYESTVSPLKQAIATTTVVQTEVIEKAVEAFATFNQGSLDAVAQAGQILASGSLDLFREMVASSQSAYAEVFAGVRALASAKTVKERIELQAGLVRTSATRAVTEGGRFAKASFDLAEKASSPLNARAACVAGMLRIPGA